MQVKLNKNEKYIFGYNKYYPFNMCFVSSSVLSKIIILVPIVSTRKKAQPTFCFANNSFST